MNSIGIGDLVELIDARARGNRRRGIARVSEPDNSPRDCYGNNLLPIIGVDPLSWTPQC